MTPPEVLHRVGQELVKRQRAAVAGRQPALRFLTPLPGLPPLTRERLISFFNVQIPYNGDESIDWHRDYSTGIRAPRIFYGRINYRNSAKVGDVKYTWELNRHQFLIPWALRYQRTGDEEEAAAIIYVLTDWIAANPRYIGINWSSSLELALRILSWGIVFDLCRDSEALRTVRPTVERSVAEQADYIRNSLSRYSSANNHLLGELVGLLASAAFFPGAASARGHAEFARGLIIEEAHLQNWTDGVNKEQAIYYHHYSLEYLATAVALFERLNFPVPEEMKDRVSRMIGFVDAMVDNRGTTFEIGDRDDGTVTGLNRETGVGIYESLLWTGWRLSGELRFAQHAAAIASANGRSPEPDERTCYWHGSAADVIPTDSETVPDRTEVFPEGGYFVRKSTAPLPGSPDYQLVFKAGPFGYPSIAAHSHADQLSVCLQVADTEILVDPGTYCYHGEDHWRRYFKGTGAHNTIRVDGLDQAEYAGPFLWANHADGKLQGGARLDDGAYSIAGLHNGYHRLQARVDHSRTLEIRNDSPEEWLIVRDTLASSASHHYELIWNFGPDVQVEIEKTTRDTEEGSDKLKSITAAVRHKSGVELGLTIFSEHPFRTDLFNGNEIEPAGWYSSDFGRRHAIYQLRVSVDAGWWGVVTCLHRLVPPDP